MPQTYYDRLGVSPSASPEEIRRAYRECLKEAHPDVSDDPDAGSRTRRLIEAKEVLTDDRERERYDRLGHRRYVAAHYGSVDPAEADVGVSTADEGSGTRDATGATASDDRRTTDVEDEWGSADAGSPGTSGTGRSRSERAQRRRQNRETRAGWNTTGRAERDGGEGTHARRWRAWDTDAPYRVHATDQTTLGSRLFPPGPSLVILAVGFAIYPVLLWATLEPRFPLVVNLVLGLCLLLLIVFLVGMPAVGIAVFGAWTVLMPGLLTVGFGVPPASPVWFVGLGGTALPLGLAVLIHVALRG